MIYNAIGVITILKVVFQMLSLSSKNYIVLKFECGKNKIGRWGSCIKKKLVITILSLSLKNCIIFNFDFFFLEKDET